MLTGIQYQLIGVETLQKRKPSITFHLEVEVVLAETLPVLSRRCWGIIMWGRLCAATVNNRLSREMQA